MYMRQEGALAAVTLGVLAGIFTWRGRTRRSGGSSSRPSRKRVSFSDSKNSFIEATLDLTIEERKALNWSPAELRQFSRAVEVDWLEEWGS